MNHINIPRDSRREGEIFSYLTINQYLTKNVAISLKMHTLSTKIFEKESFIQLQETCYVLR